jgi:hypothetical protein
MYDVNAEYDIETFEFKLKALCTNETYYDIVINRASTKKLETEQFDRHLKIFQYQIWVVNRVES